MSFLFAYLLPKNAFLLEQKFAIGFIGNFAVPKAMSSTASATLATWFKIKGVSYSISSACATSNHCIGNAYEMIQYGKQDVMFAGGCEELDWTMSVLFDAMGAMSSKYNDTPAKASRAYDVNRDGFVIAGGAGVLVLEELNHAKARGAKIYAEVVGYGLSGDAYHVTAPHPDGSGAYRSMEMALKKAGMDAGLYGGVFGNPVESQVKDGVVAFKEHKADSLVIIGGGAPLDRRADRRALNPAGRDTSD